MSDLPARDQRADRLSRSTTRPATSRSSAATSGPPCASVENGNPLFWDDEVADELTGGPIAAPSMLSTWFRPHHWAPGLETQKLPLQVHFDLKEKLGLPEAVMSDNTTIFHEPVRPGDILTHLPAAAIGQRRRRRPSSAPAGSG